MIKLFSRGKLNIL